MKCKWSNRIIFVVLVLCIIGVVASCSSPTPIPTPVRTATVAPTPWPTSTPLTDASAILSSRCTVCHTLERVLSSKKSHDEWIATTNRMLPLMNSAERSVLVDYLVKNYGP